MFKKLLDDRNEPKKDHYDDSGPIFDGSTSFPVDGSFKINCDLDNLIEEISKTRGAYFLGKMVMSEPLATIEIKLDALPDPNGVICDIAISGTVENSHHSPEMFGKYLLDAVCSKISPLVKEKFRLERVGSDFIVIYDQGSQEPGMEIYFRIDSQGGAMADIKSIILRELRLPSGFSFPSPRTDNQPINFIIFFGIGGSPNLTLKKLEINGDFKNCLGDFLGLAEMLVGALYGALNVKVGNQSLYVKPVRINSNKRPGRSSIPGLPPGFAGIPGMGGRDDLEKAISVEKPDTTFNDIGGLKDTISMVQDLSLAIIRPELYGKWGTHPPKGVLFYGPPGNGKTLLARALANTTKAKFLHVKVTDILSSMHAQSEAQVSDVFDIARENMPAIIFFDELDAIGHDRASAGSEISRRIVTTLLQNMDGLEKLERVLVVAATNRLDDIDPALRRTGRFDRKIIVPPPDEEAIIHILTIHMDKAEKTAKRILFSVDEFGSRFDLRNFLPSLKDGISGSDLAELVRRVLEKKAREDMAGKNPGLVTFEDMLNEIKTYERLEQSIKKIGYKARKKLEEETVHAN